MSDNFFNTKYGRILGLAVLLMIFLALGTYSFLNLEKIKHLDPNPAMISVAGEGEVLAVPDVGQFSFSVRAEAETADDAQRQSGERINEILSYLREEEIADEDIKVISYNLFPRWRYEEVICPAGSFCPPGNQVADGFEVTQTVRVKVRDTASAPAIIAGVGERGATGIGDLTFTIDDEEAVKAEARELAIEDALSKAKILADQLGVRLVRIMSYQEEMPEYSQLTRAMSADAIESPGFGRAELPVGENSTRANVVVTYEVR
jgi:uncharacterized protein